MTFQQLGVAIALGAVAIVMLVGFAWRTWSCRRRARTRPASPEDADIDVNRWYVERARERARLDALRKIAATDYAPKRHKDPG